MLLGTQWYVLFNVIAGRDGHPFGSAGSGGRVPLQQRGTLAHRDSARHFPLPGYRPGDGIGRRVERQHRGRILPLQGADLQTVGLGAQISSATDTGNFDLLLLSTIVMAALVVS